VWRTDDGAAENPVGVYELINDVPAKAVPAFVYEERYLGQIETETLPDGRVKRKRLTAEELAAARNPVVELDLPEAIERGIEIAQSADPAISNKGGNNQTLAVAFLMKDEGLSPGKVFEIMAAHFNQRCQPPWERGELIRIVNNAFNYGKRPPGSASAKADFKEAETEEIKQKGDPETIKREKAEREERARLRRLRAIRDIKALRDKTVANGCSGEEAATAKAKVEELIAKYKITDEELEVELPPDSAAEESASSKREAPVGAQPEDFWHHGPTNTYIFCKTSDMWAASSISTIFNRKTAIWIAQKQGVQQATWAPGYPQIVRDKLLAGDVFLDSPGNRIFNLYRPPLISDKGDPNLAGPWLDHLRRVYPDDADHILGWMAWKVQRPEKKIDHSLVFGGDPGIGKDTVIAGLRHAVGAWNCGECNPASLFDQYNASFLQKVILRVNEARDTGDGKNGKVSRYDFYEHTKTLMAAPPETLAVEEKYLKKYTILNVAGLIITTNNKTNGLYLPPDDRRHYVAWSLLRSADFEVGYFNRLWDWYAAGGFEHVAAYLRAYDLSLFNPNTEPPKTPTFWEIVGANSAGDETQLAALLAALGDPIQMNEEGVLTFPEAITVDMLVAAARRDLDSYNELYDFLTDRDNRRVIPGKLEKVGEGYVKTHNPNEAKDGNWRVGGKRMPVYTRRDLNRRDQLAAVKVLQKWAAKAAARAKARSS
jgi:hypothetical protein